VVSMHVYQFDAVSSLTQGEECWRVGFSNGESVIGIRAGADIYNLRIIARATAALSADCKIVSPVRRYRGFGWRDIHIIDLMDARKRLITNHQLTPIRLFLQRLRTFCQSEAKMHAVVRTTAQTQQRDADC